MAKVTFQVKGLEEFKRAVRRNPFVVVNETKKFLSRGMSVYRRAIQNKPWQVGGSGGGSPVDTGNLRTSHVVKFTGLFEASIAPNRNGAAPYAQYVHGDSSKPKKIRGRNAYTRPWLDYAHESKDKEIETLYRELLTNITKDLAN